MLDKIYGEADHSFVSEFDEVIDSDKALQTFKSQIESRRELKSSYMFSITLLALNNLFCCLYPCCSKPKCMKKRIKRHQRF